MSLPRLLSLAAALTVISACAETSTEPGTLDSDLLAAAADPGNGAIVERAFFNGVGLLTVDFESGLIAFHYADAGLIEALIGCAPSPFNGGLDQLRVFTPSGLAHEQARGEVYVIVHDLAGFPGNVFTCQQGLAEGPVQVHANFHLPKGPILIGSDGVITSNADGSDVRLHQRLKLDGSFNPVQATVRLQ